MRSSSVCSQIGRRRPRTVPGRVRPNLKIVLAAMLPSVKAPATAMNNFGTGPGRPCVLEFLATGATTAAAGAGAAIVVAGTLSAKMLVAGCGLGAGLTPEGSGQRETTAGDVARGSGAFDRGVSNPAAFTGKAVLDPSLRVARAGSSARALTTEFCGAAPVCGGSGFADGEMA